MLSQIGLVLFTEIARSPAKLGLQREGLIITPGVYVEMGSLFYSAWLQTIILLMYEWTIYGIKDVRHFAHMKGYTAGRLGVRVRV